MAVKTEHNKLQIQHIIKELTGLMRKIVPITSLHSYPDITETFDYKNWTMHSYTYHYPIHHVNIILHLTKNHHVNIIIQYTEKQHLFVLSPYLLITCGADALLTMCHLGMLDLFDFVSIK
jgi:hypothetical protein